MPRFHQPPSYPAMRIALTADLHWGSHAVGDEATRLLASYLQAHPPDLLVVAGDVGASWHFEECLTFLQPLPCPKALVPGNHDIWVQPDDARGDSLRVYQEHLPRVCAKHGFHYLDQGPLLFPEADLALVGSINWYDYSWSIKELRGQLPNYQERLRAKTFSRGRHNDARFVRWALDDPGFTRLVVAAMERHLHEALGQVGKVVAVVHHPPFYGLNFPRLGPPSVDALIWDALSGNQLMEELLARVGDRVPLIFCGHTHKARENLFHGIRGFNIGGDYHFKRMLLLDWPEGTVEAHTFGNPDLRR